MALIARDRELDAVVDRLRTHRLVTVVGPGGIGKTALARAAATVAGRDFAMGALAVDLTRVDDPDAVAELIAGQLGSADFPSLLGSPSDKSALLLIDNCEHVLDAAADAVDAILGACRMPTVLATSRSPLDVADESIVALAPLDVPPPDLDDADAGAVVMFAERAADLGTPLGPGDMALAAEICRRLDGVPLALEIAAARTRTSTLRQLLDEIGARPAALARPRFRGQSAHRSVTDMVGSSLALLGDDERAAFDQLGVISGPFDRAMAAAVIGGLERPVDLVLDELVAASLVVADASGDEVVHRLLHPVRAVALDRLRASGGEAAATDRAVGHTVDVAVAVMTDSSAGWDDQLGRLLGAYDNVIASLRWAHDNDDSPHRSMILLAVLWGVVHQAHRGEVAEVGERVLARWPDPSTRLWAEAAATVATCRNLLGQRDDALELARTALDEADPSPFAAAALRRVVAQALRLQGRTEEACDEFAAAADLAAVGGIHALAMEMRVDQAVLVAELGEPERAEAMLLDVLGEARGRGAAINVNWARCGLATVRQRERVEHVLDEIVEVADEAQSIGYPAGLAFALRLVAIEHLERNDHRAAAAALLELQETLIGRGGLGDLRMMLDLAAALFEQLGDERWADVAATAATLPVTSSVAAEGTRELLERAVVHGEVLTTRDVYELCRIRLGEWSGRTPGAADLTPSPTEAGRSADDPQSEPPRTVTGERRGSSLVLEGDVWRWVFADATVVVKASKGMGDLARLLASPHREVSAMDLMGSVKVGDRAVETLDRRARREIEERIRELQADVEEADAHHDLARSEWAAAELDRLVDELSAAVGLAGRARSTGGDVERARSAVTQRIRSTISRIDEMHPALGGHLAASIDTGTFCAYRPLDEVEWTIET